MNIGWLPEIATTTILPSDFGRKDGKKSRQQSGSSAVLMHQEDQYRAFWWGVIKEIFLGLEDL